MRSFLAGILMLAFGIIFGGAGIASAGVGIGIPMIPLGGYFVYRGWRILQHNKKSPHTSDLPDLTPLEKTRTGELWLCVLTFLVGLGTSALGIGIPLMAGASLYGLCVVIQMKIHRKPVSILQITHEKK